MRQRMIVGLVLVFVALAVVIAGGAAWASVGLYADATGTGGYIPPITWATGLFGIAALVAGIVILNGGRSPRGDHPDQAQAGSEVDGIGQRRPR